MPFGGLFSPFGMAARAGQEPFSWTLVSPSVRGYSVGLHRRRSKRRSGLSICQISGQSHPMTWVPFASRVLEQSATSTNNSCDPGLRRGNSSTELLHHLKSRVTPHDAQLTPVSNLSSMSEPAPIVGSRLCAQDYMILLDPLSYPPAFRKL